MFGRERFHGAENHMAGVMDDDVDASAFGNHLRDARIDRILREHVKLDCAQIDPMLLREFGHLRDDLRVPPFVARIEA